MKKLIKAATDEAVDTRLKDAIDIAQDDFDYVIMGLEHLSRQGANATTEALRILENLQNGLSSVLSEISNNQDTEGE